MMGLSGVLLEKDSASVRGKAEGNLAIGSNG